MMIIYPSQMPESLRNKASRRRPDLTIGSVPSRKLQRMVRYSSLLKRACIYLLEHDAQVTSYQENPFLLSFSYEGRESRFTPDFSVYWQHRRPWLVVCQPEAHLQDPQRFPLWTAGRLWCSQHNYIWALLTDTALRRHGALLANLDMLVVHAHQHLPDQLREYLLRTLVNLHNPWTINEVLPLIPYLTPERAISSLWCLIYTGEVVTDLTLPLQVHTSRCVWKGIVNEIRKSHL